MRNEIEYQMWVKQPMDEVMVQLKADMAQFGITDDELNRFLFEWVMERITDAPVVPEWLMKGVENE